MIKLDEWDRSLEYVVGLLYAMVQGAQYLPKMMDKPFYNGCIIIRNAGQVAYRPDHRGGSAHCAYCSKLLTTWGASPKRKHSSYGQIDRKINKAFTIDRHHVICAERWLWGQIAPYSSQIMPAKQRAIVDQWRKRLNELQINLAGHDNDFPLGNRCPKSLWYLFDHPQLPPPVGSDKVVAVEALLELHNRIVQLGLKAIEG